ncbi:transposase [Rhizobium laguerreae]|uniref:RNA-guided endonuclease InsQ/TnpB family protein n=1 Tax=Rhizobium laguerreae TaxID=1076926 RepID=UPI001C8FBCFB|nr:RNA-guided endonuclease TnpB family protein [Rhizobium laguerreae]MBY3157267.1 transposase [Rhizobium laguerreae]
MKINRGYRFKLAPTDAQKARMERHARVCRLVYNLALEQRRDHHRQFRRATGKHISYASQAAELTELRAEFDWIREVTQTCQQQALRDLDRAYLNFFSGIADYPGFRRKGVNESFRFQGREVTFRRLNKSWGMAKFPKIGEVRFRWTRDIPGKLKNVTVGLDPLGWHVSFATEQEIEVVARLGPAVGVDRGVVEPVAYSDGTFAAFPKERVKALERRTREAARGLAKCRKGSNRRKVAKARVAALRARMARVRKHFNHVETARLARTFGVVCLEALRIGNMTATAKGTVEEPGKNVAQKAGLNRSILEIGWFQFHLFLAYKMAAAGGEIRLVSAAHTSTTCSCCGTNDKTNRKSQAVYECAGCGSAMNADTNAAVNILLAGTRPAKAKRPRAASRRASRLEASAQAA